MTLRYLFIAFMMHIKRDFRARISRFRQSVSWKYFHSSERHFKAFSAFTILLLHVETKAHKTDVYVYLFSRGFIILSLVEGFSSQRLVIKKISFNVIDFPRDDEILMRKGIFQSRKS